MSCYDYQSALSVVKKILEAEPSDQEANMVYDQLQELQYFDVRNSIFTNYNGRAHEVHIPEGITEIAIGAFNIASKYIEKICLTDSITNIPKECFNNCIELKEVIWGKKLESISEYAFSNCSNLEKIILPNTLKSIRKYAFQGCIKLKEIECPDGLAEMGEHAFYNCTSLKYFKFSSRITTILAGTFGGCESLEEVVFQEGLISIEAIAFYDCASLKRVVLPSGLRNISDRSFNGCESLELLNIPDSVISIGKAAFGGTNIHSLYIPHIISDPCCIRNCHSLDELDASIEFKKNYREAIKVLVRVRKNIL